MICVLSQSSLESTTEAVIGWLRSWGTPVIRLNVEDIRQNHLSVAINENGITVSCEAGPVTFSSDLIKVVWLRRWRYYNVPSGPLLVSRISQEDFERNSLTLGVHLRRELRSLSEFIFESLSRARWLNKPERSIVNKLRVLKLASECGLDVPDTLISTDASALSEFASRHGRVVTKSIGDTFICELDGRSFASYTSVIRTSDLKEGPERLFPTLLQECLDKEYEIRAFYLDGRFYSMAIFSQTDEQTSVDFRRYLFARPNRTVPFHLPVDLASKLSNLMSKLDLETGSIDLVKTRDGRIIFLEVNPAGQFGMVSYPCNYHLDREVASALVRRLGRG
ncbi:MAG TPA: grasp-with-spasm system ATP-grasp peptide maturase [Blastocatellia bacterium]|nr:grasp-with-spasm system ATP-grasp peptide maturase [Blastocatellia bacterium]